MKKILAEIARLEDWQIAISFGETSSSSPESKLRRKQKLLGLINYWLSSQRAATAYQRFYTRQLHGGDFSCLK